MPSIIPITLCGPNLGARHRYLNSLVHDSFVAGHSIEDVLKLQERSHIDRLYKIDLASKHKRLEYILQSLQDEDMLFVSRALKSKWLLEEDFHHIINPFYLETDLYPHMLTTSINKMKHWIHLNLRNEQRCVEFYEYYLNNDQDYAFKFLYKCPVNKILKEVSKPNTLKKITPQRLKMLCEKSSAVAKLFYQSVADNKSLMKILIKNEQKYFDSIKCVLKTDSDIFLDIVENHFSPELKRLSSGMTKFILENKRDRFNNKPEFYTSRIVNMSTLAQCLSSEECADLVTKLARAEYLKFWFNYKNVEPLVKRLDVDIRVSFKNKIFVDKDVGDKVLEWPYTVPDSLAILLQNTHESDFEDDIESEIYKKVFLYEPELSSRYMYGNPNMALMSRNLCFAQSSHFVNRMQKSKTLLDDLFDEYRFMSFDKTLFELRQKIKCESSSQNRMFMFLILVSKSGGKSVHLDALFDLLAMHKNEPSQVRAAVIRSLVKRVSVWRVSEAIWQKFLDFGRGLGLDGNETEADCVEGLHAVVIRNLLSQINCDRTITTAFINNTSTFAEYPLSTQEKELIKEPLFKMLVNEANEAIEEKNVACILESVVDVLQQYKINSKTQQILLTSVKNLMKKNILVAKTLAQRLYSSKIGRKELFKEYFYIIQSDASYINALKHDVSVLTAETFVKSVAIDNMKANQFLKKVSIYFCGRRDLSSKFLDAFRAHDIQYNLARPICYLIGKDLISYIIELDNKDDVSKRFSARVRANAHLSRPALNINSLEWEKVGTKLISNKVIRCKAVNIDTLIEKLLSRKLTARLSLVLAHRTNNEADIYEACAKIKPTGTLKSGLTYLRRQKDQPNLRIWSIVKDLLIKTKSLKTSPNLLKNIMDVKSISTNIRTEYLVEVYKTVTPIDYEKSISILDLLTNVFSNVDQIFIGNVLRNFVENRFLLAPPTEIWNSYHLKVNLHLNLLIKHLLFCKTEEEQNKRFDDIGHLYLDRLKLYWESPKSKDIFLNYIRAITSFLRNTEVFTNKEYVSSLPIMKEIVKWLRQIMPIEQNFNLFVPFHLNMLYCKAIRLVGEQDSTLYTDMKRWQEAYKRVGETLGSYITEEARILAKTYFDSIIVPYSDVLTDICAEYKNDKWKNVQLHLIKEIINKSTGFECLLAVKLYDNYRYRLDDNQKADLLKNFEQKDIMEMQFFYGNWDMPNYNKYRGVRVANILT